MDIVKYKIILFSVRAVKHSHLYRENKQKYDGSIEGQFVVR